MFLYVCAYVYKNDILFSMKVMLDACKKNANTNVHGNGHTYTRTLLDFILVLMLLHVCIHTQSQVHMCTHQTSLIHPRIRWNVHRHKQAPVVGGTLQQLQQSFWWDQARVPADLRFWWCLTIHSLRSGWLYGFAYASAWVVCRSSIHGYWSTRVIVCSIKCLDC